MDEMLLVTPKANHHKLILSPERRLDFISCVAHVEATRRIRLREEILDDPHAHVVAEPLQLLVHILDVLKVAQHLRHECSVGQRQKL